MNALDFASNLLRNMRVHKLQPTPANLLLLIRSGRKTVKHLVNASDLSYHTVEKYLKVLRYNGLIHKVTGINTTYELSLTGEQTLTKLLSFLPSDNDSTKEAQ